MSKIGFRFMSWNLKDFGNYDYSNTMAIIADTIIANQVDVVVLLEVFSNRGIKKAKIGEDYLTPGGVDALRSLDEILEARDSSAGWEYDYSGANCENQDRDTYAFFWRTKPYGFTTADFVLPTGIRIESGPTILKKGENGKNAKFSGSRRPAGCNFVFTNANTNPTEEKAVLAGFHAYAQKSKTADRDTTPAKEIAKIKSSLKDGVSVAKKHGIDSNIDAVVVGGDLNLDYNVYSGWYDMLDYHCGITENGGSSLLTSPKFTSQPVVLAGKAFDNFLYNDSIRCLNAKVVSVIGDLHDYAGFGWSEAFVTYYPTKKEKSEKKSSCVSDHLPILGEFIFL